MSICNLFRCLVVIGVLLTATERASAIQPIDVAESVSVMCQAGADAGCAGAAGHDLCVSYAALACGSTWDSPPIRRLGALHAPPRAFDGLFPALAPPASGAPAATLSRLCAGIEKISNEPATLRLIGEYDEWARAYGALASACGLPTRSVRGLADELCQKLRAAANDQADAVCKASARADATEDEICKSAAALGAEATQLRTACGKRRLSVGGAAALAPLIEGLGDFLKVRAKEELIGFALSTLGSDLCTPPDDPAKLDVASFFEASCKAIFPNGTKRAPDIDAITGGRFEAALNRDLEALPAKILSTLPLGQVPDGEHQREILQALAKHLQLLGKDPKKYQTFLRDVEGEIAPKLRGRLEHCRFGTANPPSSACLSALYLTFAATARDRAATAEGVGEAKDVVEEWVRRAEARFCTTYHHPAKDRCLIAADMWPVVDQAEQAVTEFVERLEKAVDKLDRDRKTAQSLATLAEDSAVISDTFSDFLGRLVEIARSAGAGDARQLEAAAIAFDLSSAGLRVGSAVLSRDHRAAAEHVRVVLEHPWTVSNMPADARKAALFFVDLSSAEDRSEARALIEDVAAPLGSYQRKYDGEWHVAINGYVGVYGEHRWRGRTDAEDLSAYEESGLEAVPLGAPVGLDVTFPGWKGFHAGLGLLVIDPLAIDTAGERGQTLNGVLAPGLALRFGLGGSPVVLTLAGRYQPLLEAGPEGCDPSQSENCWRGQMSVMAGLAVDVPIFMLE